MAERQTTLPTPELADELLVEEGGWLGRAITLGALMLVAAFAAALTYYFFFTGDSTEARPTEDLGVGRATINSTLLISGVADAQLNSNLTFRSSGKVAAVNVKMGETVTGGQVLAELESAELRNAVASAQANARMAQLKLQDLLDGADVAEIAAAEQAVAQAKATLAKAENDERQLREGASPSDVAAAQQAVSSAEAQLESAQAKLDALEDTPNDADVAAAEAAVASAQSALTAAENSADSAQNTLTSAAAALKSAEFSYCAADSEPAFCTTQAAPVSAADVSLLQAALSGANSSLASAVIAANSTYLNASNSAQSAESSVASAQEALASAEAKLDLAQDGPSAAEVAAAEAAVTSAESALEAAREKQSDLLAGADAGDLAAAAAAVESARASVDSAQARLDQLLRGPEANAIAQAREAVEAANLTVEAAQIRLSDAQIVAPYDGTVAAVSIRQGEFVGPAAAEPAIVLLTPDRLTLQMDIGETDYTNVEPGQRGGVLFDGLPGHIYPFAISELGLSPSVSQGVVTYPATATIVIPPDAPRPAPGMNGRGQLVLDSRRDVIAVPLRAVRRSGSEQVVDVRRDSAVVEQPVRTGVSDAENVEILEGLSEGDTIVVPVLRGTGGDDAEAEPTLPGGIR